MLAGFKGEAENAADLWLVGLGVGGRSCVLFGAAVKR